ncbi:DUF3221 domain-containing protein [Paenibacillus lemnae]|uniref:DUF3221 domain-containing protein n=1 Tax=Paenibacillus lemnae TaxID=1330551 RepID=A0A848M4B9_PAELE|nr:DUF3221 domain-containing protein [Paenibacillus lemnae]NMO95081.1 DUF3221 domain-containing protein [Paenibacillus lemnae]
MMRIIKIIISGLILICAGCANPGDSEEKAVPEFRGYIIDISKDKILVAGGSIVKEDIKTLSMEEILEKASPDAVWLGLPSGSKETDYAVGDQVDVWTTGNMNHSYPAQGTATKIVITSE